MPVATKPLTVRLPNDLYADTSELARRKKISMNALVQEGLKRLMKDEEYARLYAAFGELGDEDSNVEFAAHAQWEVVSHGDD